MSERNGKQTKEVRRRNIFIYGLKWRTPCDSKQSGEDRNEVDTPGHANTSLVPTVTPSQWKDLFPWNRFTSDSIGKAICLDTKKAVPRSKLDKNVWWTEERRRMRESERVGEREWERGHTSDSSHREFIHYRSYWIEKSYLSNNTFSVENERKRDKLAWEEERNERKSELDQKKRQMVILKTGERCWLNRSPGLLCVLIARRENLKWFELNSLRYQMMPFRQYMIFPTHFFDIPGFSYTRSRGKNFLSVWPFETSNDPEQWIHYGECHKNECK